VEGEAHNNTKLLMLKRCNGFKGNYRRKVARRREEKMIK
jgi:hypothetical protein